MIIFFEKFAKFAKFENYNNGNKMSNLSRKNNESVAPVILSLTLLITIIHNYILIYENVIF